MVFFFGPIAECREVCNISGFGACDFQGTSCCSAFQDDGSCIGSCPELFRIDSSRNYTCGKCDTVHLTITCTCRSIRSTHTPSNLHTTHTVMYVKDYEEIVDYDTDGLQGHKLGKSELAALTNNFMQTSSL